MTTPATTITLRPDEDGDVDAVIAGPWGEAIIGLDALPGPGRGRFDVVLYEPDLDPPVTVLTGRDHDLDLDLDAHDRGNLDSRPRLPTASVGSAELYLLDVLRASDGSLGVEAFKLPKVDLDGLVAAYYPDDEATPTTVVDGVLDEVPVGDGDNPLDYVLDDALRLDAITVVNEVLGLGACSGSGERLIGAKAGDVEECQRCGTEVTLEAFPDGDHPLSAMVPAHVPASDSLEDRPEPNTAPPTGGELCDVGTLIEALDEALRGSPIEVAIVVTGGTTEVIGTIVDAGHGHVFRSSEGADRFVGAVDLSLKDLDALTEATLENLVDRGLAR